MSNDPSQPLSGAAPAPRDLKKLVADFSEALLAKLEAAEKKYGYNDGWRLANWEDELREDIREHLDKGDPRDVAAYCAFAWHHGWSLSAKLSPAAPVAVPAQPRHVYDDSGFKRICVICNHFPCDCEISEDDDAYGEPDALPPPQEPTDQEMLDTAMLMVDRLVSKFPQMEAAVIRPALKLEALQMMCTFGKEIRAAASSRIAQLEQTLKAADDAYSASLKAISDAQELQPTIDDLKFGMEEEMKTLKTRAETAEAALTQAQQEQSDISELLKKSCDREWKDENHVIVATIASNGIYWRNEEIKELRAQKSALMQAIEPYVTHGDLTTNSAWQRAKRVYEQVKRGQ